jgi:hypothetical protein
MTKNEAKNQAFQNKEVILGRRLRSLVRFGTRKRLTDVKEIHLLAQ